MDSRELQYVIVISEKGSFSEAAKYLSVSQPALSQYVRRVEDRLGCDLFLRGSQGLRLTPAGVTFVKKGRVILSAISGLEKEMAAYRWGKKEGITVGASQFYGKYLLVPMLDVLRSTASDHHVEILEGSSDHLEEEILKGRLDLGFFPEPIHHEDINFVPIYEEEVYFAHAAENKDAAALIGHAWDGKSLNLAPFRDLPFVMLRKGLKFHDLTQRLCREYDFFPKAIYESDNLDTVYSLVSHNYGVAFLPSTLLPVLTKKDSNVRFYPLASKKAQRRIGIAYLGTRFKEKKMRTLAKEIRNRLLGAQIAPR
ncbi:LysR family transcriptional regulator [uncultured Acidaminococcus sp.]|uniref:LysR family transcriptional regulator n=1 Tax=uncultured Acidaminococcus sp. TaxID=352152 RepID=UPI0025FEE734|nr:LysR family transcriptional regulator [uncultured Acidaminococcus sp.]